jgi:hypothetical protein
MGKSAFGAAIALQAEGRLREAAALYRHVLPGRRGLLGSHPGPRFLIIGAPRAGTAWLKKCLGAHPQIRILASEIHYFSMRFTEPPGAYLKCFEEGSYKGAELDRTGPVVFGEKSPSYIAMDKTKVELCAALFPDLRIICNVRDPVARAWSHMQLAKMGPDRFGGHHYRKLIAYGRYSFWLRQWASHFAPEQIHLVDFAQIASDPVAVFDGVCRHIGVPTIEPFPGLWTVRGRLSTEAPPEILARLEAEYEDEPFDAPTLRAVIDGTGAGMTDASAPR